MSSNTVHHRAITLIQKALFLFLPSLLVMVAGGKPQLPFGDINVLVVTDVHSFISGHPHEPNRNADYGDVLSFYQHVKEYCDSQGSDLWFFMNGDWIHGTGLAMDGNATKLVPLLEHMPWDAINLGNHEIYKSAVVELMRDDMIPHYGEAFLATNTKYAKTMEPFAGRYRLLHGVNNTLLVFGFLYHVPDPSALLHVEKVQATLNEDWFREVLRETEYDAICVLAHMDNDDPLIQIILKKIREHVDEDMPVQFLTGHTHARKEGKVGNDRWAHAMESGGNLDTVGFVGIPTHATAQRVHKLQSRFVFPFTYIEPNKENLRQVADVETLLTDDGLSLSQKINQTRYDMGLHEIIGCPPWDYFRNKSRHQEDSLQKLWAEHVVPTQIFKRQGNCAMLISFDNFRYDVRGSGKDDAMTVDDIVAVAPYMERVVYVGEVPEWVIKRMNTSMNTQSLNKRSPVPDYVLAGTFDAIPDNKKMYKLYTHEYNMPEVMFDLDRLHEHNLKPQVTDMKDTLYWLEYAEEAWQCSHHKEQKHVKPWFTDIKELDEEKTDGEEFEQDEQDSKMDDDLDSEATGAASGGKKNKGDGSGLHYEGYEGYLPPHVLDDYGDLLPPNVSPSTVLKPQDRVPTFRPTNPPGHAQPDIQHTAARNKAAKRARRKKIRLTAYKIVGGLLAVALLSIPLYGLYNVFFPDDKRRNHVMSEETFYDMKEMRAHQRRNGHRPLDRPLPREIQLT